MFATGYFDWGASDPYTMPAEYRAIFDSFAPGFTTAVDQQSTTPTEDWMTTAMRTASLLAMTDAQRRLMNIQLDRAKAGLPPLKTAEYSPGVQLDIGLEKAVLVGGGLLLAAFLLLKKGR